MRVLAMRGRDNCGRGVPRRRHGLNSAITERWSGSESLAELVRWCGGLFWSGGLLVQLGHSADLLRHVRWSEGEGAVRAQ